MRRRLLISTCWPIVVIVGAAASLVGLELARDCFEADRAVARDSKPTPGHTAVQGVLPLTLVLTFVIVPSTATRIFKTFQCDRIEYDETSGAARRYLADDLALDCDGPDYAATRTTANIMLILWPVGVPLMYAVLLWASRDALLAGTSTRLSRATAFLSGDYEAVAFWWEPLEMCRKLTLTGDCVQSQPLEVRGAFIDGHSTRLRPARHRLGPADRRELRASTCARRAARQCHLPFAAPFH